jgi:hypothetical protein
MKVYSHTHVDPWPIHHLWRLATGLPTLAIMFWWTNQEFSPVDIIPPWFSMLIYYLGDEQMHVGVHISPHWHDHHHQLKLFLLDKSS